jgi:hypothetical protein
MVDQFTVAKAESARKLCVDLLTEMAQVWDKNTSTGSGIRQCLRYLDEMDFHAPKIRNWGHYYWETP